MCAIVPRQDLIIITVGSYHASPHHIHFIIKLKQHQNTTLTCKMLSTSVPPPTIYACACMHTHYTHKLTYLRQAGDSNWKC